MKITILKLSLLLTILILSSCSGDDNNQITGSGNIISEERVLESFKKVISPSSIDISVVYGVAQNITVSADDNIIDRISTIINNETLTIDLIQGNYNNINANVVITIPIVTEVKNTGSGSISCSDFIDLDNIAFVNSGSGSIVANGSSANMSLNNSGSGSFKGFGFMTENCTISSSGSGSCELFSNTSLTGVLSGSGNILYKGSATVTINDTGSGNVINSN